MKRVEAWRLRDLYEGGYTAASLSQLARHNTSRHNYAKVLITSVSQPVNRSLRFNLHDSADTGVKYTAGECLSAMQVCILKEYDFRWWGDHLLYEYRV